MNIESKKDETFEAIEILENVTIVYEDGINEQFDAVRVTTKGVVFGRILDNGEYVECGFISQHNIKHIRNGTKRKIYKKI